MSWSDKTTVKKGDIGEDIVKNFLLEKGMIPYKPDFDGAHPFDFLCATRDKKTMIIVDAKAKARMNKQFNGFSVTGIDKRHFNEYKHIQKKYNVHVYLYFVDEMLGSVYGNAIARLEKNKIEKNWKTPMILFRLIDMVEIGKLSSDEVHKLKKHSTRSYDYSEKAAS